MALYEILSDHAILFVLSDIQPSPSGNCSRPVKAVTFSPASWKLQASRLQVWRHKENWTMMDNGHSIRWMHLHKQTDQLVIDYIVYKRYKSHLDLAISVLLFDRRFWDHVIIPMIAMKFITNLSAILRPPNPQFASPNDLNVGFKLRSIWSALGSSSALSSRSLDLNLSNWTKQLDSSTARQLDTPGCQSLSSLSQGPGSIPHLDPKSRQPAIESNGSHCF